MSYNLMTCSGWEEAGSGFVGSLPCMKARLGLVFLFFIIAIVRKWGGEEVGLGFSFVFSLLLGIIPYLFIVVIFGSFKVAMIVGLAGALIGGYGAGIFFGGED